MDETFSKWVTKAKLKTNARCFIRGKDCDLSSIRVDRLINHDVGKNTRRNQINSLHSSLNSTHSSSSSSAIGSSSSTCRTFESCVSSESIIRSEILGVLRVVITHSPLRSFEEIDKFFLVMFNDIKTADSLKLGRLNVDIL